MKSFESYAYGTTKDLVKWKRNGQILQYNKIIQKLLNLMMLTKRKHKTA